MSYKFMGLGEFISAMDGNYKIYSENYKCLNVIFGFLSIHPTKKCS